MIAAYAVRVEKRVVTRHARAYRDNQYRSLRPPGGKLIAEGMDDDIPTSLRLGRSRQLIDGAAAESRRR
jgi:hypothetical protein